MEITTRYDLLMSNKDLKTLCQEILEFHQTNKLDPNSKFQLLINSLNAPKNYRIRIAENLVTTEAMKYVAGKVK